MHGPGIDEIGHGVEALDRKPGEAVDDDPLGGGGPGRKHRDACDAKALPARPIEAIRGEIRRPKRRRFFPAVVPS